MHNRSWKWLFPGLLLVFCLHCSPLAVAEPAPNTTPASLPAPFIGCFTVERIIRVTPRSNTDPLISVPKNTSLYLTPVNEEYAETSYAGVTGYIFYQDAIPAETESTPVVPFVAYSKKALVAYAQPHVSGDAAAGFAAYTPLEISAECGEFVVLAQEGAQDLYIPNNALLLLKEDTDVTPYRAYLRAAGVLYRYPLTGAPVRRVLPMSIEVEVSAENGDYARVSVDGGSGYVLLANLMIAPNLRTSASFAYALKPTVLYDQPSAHAYTDSYTHAGVILEIDGVAGSFSHIKNLDAYVPTDSLKKLEATRLKTPIVAYWEAEQTVYQNTSTNMAPLTIRLKPNVPVEIRWSFGSYYLIQLESQWGLVPKAGAHVIKATKHSKASFYVASMGTAYYANPIPGEAPAAALTADVVLTVTESFNGFVKTRQEEPFQYVSLENLERIADVKKVSAYEAYFDSDTPVLDIPHAAGEAIAQVSGNQIVRIGRQNDEYAYVSAGKAKGYVALNQIRKMSALFEDAQDISNYYLFLNKATKVLTVYHADQDGRRTDSIARQVTVAIGKRTTPTPSGIFPLGSRERWHNFGDTVAPFAIKYASGRYLHGPLYSSADEKTIIRAHLSEFGRTVTGGCIRIPYADMLWIYTHCMKDNAVLEVVNGA